jgi:hypothetical protein
MIQVARQRVQVGIVHAGATATIHTTDTTFRVYIADELAIEVPRTTDRPIARFKERKPEARRPRPAAQ